MTGTNDDTIDRRTVLQGAGLALAGAAVPAVGAAESEEIQEIDLSAETSLTKATVDRTYTHEHDAVVQAVTRAATDVENNNAQALAQLVFIDGLGSVAAEAETGVLVTPAGDEPTEVEISVDGTFSAEVTARQFAGAFANATLRVVDEDAGDRVARDRGTQIGVGTSDEQPFNSDSVRDEPIDATVTATLEPDTTYRLGVAAEAGIPTMGGGGGEVDVEDTGLWDFPGGVTWDEITITPV